MDLDLNLHNNRRSPDRVTVGGLAEDWQPCFSFILYSKEAAI